MGKKKDEEKRRSRELRLTRLRPAIAPDTAPPAPSVDLRGAASTLGGESARAALSVRSTAAVPLVPPDWEPERGL